MAGTLIYAEVQKGEIKKGSFEVTCKAKELGGEVAVCLIGKGAEALAPQLAKYGADKIYVVDGPEYENYVTEAFVQAFKQVADTVKHDVILASATAQGKDLIPAIAARLGVGAISDSVDLKKEGDKVVAKRPMYAGKGMPWSRPRPEKSSAAAHSFSVRKCGAGAVREVAVQLDTRFKR